MASAFKDGDMALTFVAHEIRNSLQAINNAGLALKASKNNPARQDKLTDVITRQSEHLSSLVDCIVHLNRIKQGKDWISKDCIDVPSLVGKALEICEPQFAAKGLVPIFETSRTDECLKGNEVLLVQVVTNLLNNACKHSQHGGQIHIAVDYQPKTVTLTVTDFGDGIETSDLVQIFGLFKQGRIADSSGLGAGLYLVNEFVRLHQGEVRAHSDGPGKGAKFMIQLPLCPEGFSSSEWHKKGGVTNGRGFDTAESASSGPLASISRKPVGSAPAPA